MNLVKKKGRVHFGCFSHFCTKTQKIIFYELLFNVPYSQGYELKVKELLCS